MNFLDLLDGAEYLVQQGNPQIEGLDYDSRRVRPGWCFVAMRGETSDGNGYIDAALSAGAVAVVSDSLPRRPDVAWVQVPHGRRALARLSANFYGRPAERLSITGITGTNGKTWTAFILNAMLRAAGRKAALVGTVEYRIGDEVLPAPHTTPEALELNQLFARALDAGCTEAVIGLAPNLFYGTSTPACIVVARRPGDKPAERKGKALLINAHRDFEVGRAQNYLRPEH